jgi:D-proline reductase (dithiol) PrdB
LSPAFLLLAKPQQIDSMANYDDLSLITRAFLRRYPFARRRIDPVPCAPLRRPLRECRLALVTTAGLYTPEQENFNYLIMSGDTSFREIPNSIETGSLLESHRSPSWDHRGVEADRNLAFPLDRFRDLVARGEIKGLNHRHFSFMGSVIGTRPLIEETAPEVARRLREDGVDAVLLTPV